MIIKASQRSFGKELAAHLLNEKDNDYVEVHAINGFAADTLHEAFEEAEAVSNGTKCTQYLFSVSLSPPKDANVSTATYEDAIERVSRKLGLQDQPHVIVFHEKEARRHCHVVYSRINADEMKAVNLPYFKNKLMEVSKELYLEHDWRLPQGFIDKSKRNPLNFTLHEWQQAKRLGHDPKMTKLVLKECWAVSDNKQAFQNALEQHGFYLARGERRGMVAVDWKGKVFSLSKWCGVKPKALQERLGDQAELPTVEEATASFDQALMARMQNLGDKVTQSYEPKLAALKTQKVRLKERLAKERQELHNAQQKRFERETKIRQDRLGSGIRGIWNRMTGRYARIKKQNELETYEAMLRDRAEKDKLIFHHIEQRQSLQQKIDHVQQARSEALLNLRNSVNAQLPEHKAETVKTVFDQYQNRNERDLGLDR